MPTYKLTYFNVTGLGELIRYLFAYGDIEFEDYRIAFSDWPEHKSKYYWGSLPVLEIDGKEVTQSLAIGRYLAKQIGINGKNDWEDLQINIAVDIINDVRMKIAAASYEPDENAKKLKYEALQEYYNFNLPKLNDLAEGGYFALGRITLADIFFAAIHNYLKNIAGTDVFEGYSNLKRVVENVESHPSVKKYIETRPETIV